MFLVALTGGIASGKSTVSSQLAALGCAVVDADLAARQVVEPGSKALREICRVFGSDILLDDGHLDREKLGKIIFHDVSMRRKLNSITHPEIYKIIAWQVLTYFIKGYRYVVLDLPLLFESGTMVPYMTEIVVVSCQREQQLERLMARNRLSEEEANHRVNSQMALEDKISWATVVIDNCRSLDNTKSQVDRLYDRLERSQAYWKLRLSFLCCGAVIIGVFYAVWQCI